MNNSGLLIYQDSHGKVKIDVRLEEETVWLTQEHMAQLFGKAKSTINEKNKWGRSPIFSRTGTVLQRLLYRHFPC